ncbi:MAG: Fic family protein [Bacteroidales bacterium]|nr:Fic family protein [Bacteroidales bacterium]
MDSEKKNILNEYEQYLRQGEPSRRKKALTWATSIGLQQVDGLQTSEYLRDVARRNIEDEITTAEGQQLIASYYEQLSSRQQSELQETEEADRAAANIAHILSTATLDFTTHGFKMLHRQIFKGVFKHAGEFRDYDISKREWVLRGASVLYLGNADPQRALDYDIEQERQFSYTKLSNDEIVQHITRFVAGLWQIHPFGEGNTRTTAVFTIQYLRSLGFDVDNDLFALNSWYFRNALVRANYKSAQVDYEPVFLERFFRNLLLGEQWELRNRYMLIGAEETIPNKHRTSTEQVPNKFDEPSLNVAALIKAIGRGQLKGSEAMAAIGLKHLPTFLANYLTPSIEGGFVAMLYPNSPRHPRQRYLLTPKGLMYFNAHNNQ